MKEYDPVAGLRWGGARTWVLVSLIALLAILVPVGLYLVSTLSFGNGTTGANLSVPDTGVTASAAPAAPAAPAPNRTRPAANNPNNAGPTSTMNLLVIDQQTKQPIAGLRVNSDMRTRFSGDTDADGRVRVVVPSGKNPNVSLRVSGKNYVPMRLVWAPYNSNLRGEVPTDYTLAMERGTKVQGKIVDDGGEPVVGATVILDFQKSGANPHEQFDLSPYNRARQIKSGDDGSWTFNGAPVDCDEIGLAAWDYQHVTGDYWNPQPFTPVSKLYDGTAVFTLRRGVTLDGVVVNPEGSPVAGAAVALGQQRFSSNAIPAENTDASGHFSYHFDPGQQILLTIQAKGFAPQLKRFAMGQQKQSLTIQLSSPHRITGTVVNASGNPVPNARIDVQSWQGTNNTLNANFQTDGTGHFHWNEAPAEPVTVSVSAQGLRGVNDQVLTPDQDNVIKLGAVSHIRGTVTDAETGKPIENIQVVFGIKFNPEQPVFWQPGMSLNAVRPGGKFDFTDQWPYPGIAVKIEASGYMPVESRVVKSDEGDVTLDLKMKPGKDLILTVQSADGKPVAGATAAMALPGQQVFIQNSREIQNNMVSTAISGADGRIDFPPQSGNFKIAVIADAGYAETDQDALAKSPVVTLSPWGRIEGRMMVGSKPATGINVDVFSSGRYMAYDAQQPRVFDQLNAKTDDDGKFVVDRVPPGGWTVGRRVQLSSNSWTDAAIQSVEVEPGKTVSVNVGGTGRAVEGKVIVSPELSGRTDWAYGYCQITSQRQVSFAGPPMPLLVRMSSAETQQKWMRDWMKTDAGKAYAANQQKAFANMRNFPFSVSPDGSFRVDDVPAGDYQLSINIQQTNNQNGFGQPIGMGSAEFTIPEMPGGRSDEPLQLESVWVVGLAKYKVGDSVFDLAMRTPEGKNLKLSDFRGKYVLLDFFRPFDTNIASFKDVYAAYGGDGRLALLTINPEFLMKGQNPPRLNSNPWPQTAIVGQSNWAVINTNFGAQNSTGAWLIGPDGKVVAEDLNGNAIKSAVIAALGAPATQPATAP
ncbi:MAG: carboxypeptidase regulatory-like domain-containing protein [Tepidisphaeraceae bacterium]|jgi:carboxypeptidase family protein